MSEQRKDIVDLIHSEVVLPLFQIAHKAETDAGAFGKFHLGQAEGFAPRLDEGN